MGLRGPRAKGLKGRAPVVVKGKRPKIPTTGTRAERNIAFCESLPITKGILAGKRMSLLPCQRDFVRAIYDAPDRVRIGVFSAPKGSGKTGMTAALALCHLVGPEAEPRGEVYSASIDREMASVIFAEMVATIEATPDLAALVNVVRFHKRIEVMSGPAQGSIFAALSGDARHGHAIAPSLWIYDELAQAKDAELLDNLTMGMGKRARALGLVISTQAASDDHPLSRLIDDAANDPSIVAHVISAPEDVDPFDPAVLLACNPASGIYLNERDLMADLQRARRVPGYASAYRNLRLNQRVAAEGRWLPLDAWDACESADLPEDGPAFLGLDLSSTRDLTAMVILLPDGEGGYGLRTHFWCPKDNLIERGQRDHVPYPLWAEQGHLTATPGNVVDYGYVEQAMKEAMERYDVREIAMDQHNSRQLFARWEVDQLPVIAIPQTLPGLTTASKECETLVISGKLRHDGNPVMRWCVANAVADTNADGLLKPSKKRSHERIDGVSALVTALARAMVAPPVPERVSSWL